MQIKIVYSIRTYLNRRIQNKYFNYNYLYDNKNGYVFYDFLKLLNLTYII